MRVCVLVTTVVSPAKTSELIEMPFVELTHVSPARNHVSDESAH